MRTLLITIPDHPDLPQWAKGFKMPVLVLDTPVYYTLAEDEHAGNRRIIDKNLCTIVTGSKGLPVKVENLIFDPDSQKTKLREHLLKYGSIQKLGPMGSLKLYGVDALSQRVRELVRDEHMNITTEKHNGNGYAIYHLQKIEK